MQRITVPAVLVAALLLAGCNTLSGDSGFAQPIRLTASFDMTPADPGSFDGNWHYRFDPSSSSDPEGEIVEFRWNLSGLEKVVDSAATVSRGFGRNGSYEIELVVVDDDGNTARAEKQLVINDLPYDYWGTPPERVNVNANGLLSNESVGNEFAVSQDGRHIAFTTASTNLVSGEVNGSYHELFLKNMETGEVYLLSDGGDTFELQPNLAMSPDSRHIAYTEIPHRMADGPMLQVFNLEEETGYSIMFSADTSLRLAGMSDDGQKTLFSQVDPGELDARTYLLARQGFVFTRLGLRRDGSYADIRPVALTGDARYAAFTSLDDELVSVDTNAVSDLFVTDLDSDLTIRASETSERAEGKSASDGGMHAFSESGRFVVLRSSSSNFPGSNGADQIYVKDLQIRHLELVSSSPAGEAGDGPSRSGSISKDGRYVAFGSNAGNLVPPIEPDLLTCDSSCRPGLGYVKDRRTGRVALITVGMDGTLPDEASQVGPRISGDGRHIVFYSNATNLAPDGYVGGGLRWDLYRTENPLWEE